MKHNDLLIQAEENLTNEERLALWRQRMQDYLDKKCPDEAMEPAWWTYVDNDSQWIEDNSKGEK